MRDNELRASEALTGPLWRARVRDNDWLLTAVFVFAGYYLGARVGFALTFLPNPISVLWLPNAIVFAALLLVPRSSWWVVVAAALPAHLMAQMQSNVPLPMVLCWFVSNVTEALIGAGLMRWLVRRPIALDTRFSVLCLLFAIVVAAFASSFLDSAFVALNRWGQRGYWEVWRTRFYSNVTSALIVIPLIVTWVQGAGAAIRTMNRPRAIEATLLLVALCSTAVIGFTSSAASIGAPALLYLPLPCLLWAALRFGPIGASTAFAIVASMVVWGVGHRVGPFDTSSPLDSALSVQIFLMLVAPTLLCLAAAVEERRNADTSLRIGERRFRLALEATDGSAYDRTVKTDRLWWNGTSLAKFGYAAQDRPRNFASWLNLIHPEDRETVLRASRGALDHGRQGWQCEFRLRAADGSYVQVREQGFVVRDEDGDPVQTVGALGDVSERHAAYELGQRLAQASRLTAMGELTASIAHEINQPMSAILSNVDAAEMVLDAGEVDKGELRRILEDIRSDDLRASEVIRHIRDLANNRLADRAEFDINDLVESVLKLVSQVARSKRVRTKADLGRVPRVYGDRIHVQQVLLNLILNGMDAMAAVPEGGRVLRVKTATVGDGVVAISVRDRGHGIASENVARIFDPFFTTKRDGMGLGLSIARSLIEAAGGKIWAENNADAGTTFSFTLPTRAPGEAVRSRVA
jgi:PAS domain S-box-containing protein